MKKNFTKQKIITFFIEWRNAKFSKENKDFLPNIPP